MNLSRTKLFTGSTMGNVEPQMQYVRLKKEGVGFWFKGQVTEAFPPEDVASNHPWKIVNITGVGEPNQNGDYSSYEFSVWPGTINGLIPSNLFNGGELRKFNSDSTLKNVLLKCTSNGRELNACTIEVSSSLPTPDAAVKYGVPSNLNIVLGAVVKASAFQVEFDNLSATPQMVYIKEKSSPAAGEYPYEVYLNWIYHGYQGTGGGGGWWGEY